ncbi:holo-ACP synthase [Lentisphaerota bacterium WC36G]|nr:holo-ACP synthase [Lentisphaerae bacterium WC36]
MIIGIGTDIIEICRIEKIISGKNKQQFLERIFNKDELTFYSEKIANANIDNLSKLITFVAGRWAVKEAVAKSLGCGISENCSFHDITVLNDQFNCPRAQLDGRAQKYCCEIAQNKFNSPKIDEQSIFVTVSISHEKNYATAMAVIEVFN